MKGCRQKERDGSHRAKPRKNTHQRPDQDSRETEEKVDGLKSNSKPKEDMVKDTHGSL
jgi:hypothetical protein